MFIKFRKRFCRFLIPISLSINPLFLYIFAEKVNAQIITFTCDVKTHVQQWEDEDWSDLRNDTFDLEVDYKNNLLVRRKNVFLADRNFPLVWNYSIVTNDRNKIVAFEKKDMTTVYGGLSASSITLDLISKKLTTANHMNDERGYAFTLHHGKCLQK